MDNKNNILVILCDQLRIDILKCYGGNLVRTPNIDALCKESVIFEKAYTPTAICSPARASLMTGLYPHGHHMFNNSTPTYSYCEHLRPDITMIQDWADSETNYETAYFGKWHIGNAQDLFNSRFHNTHPKPYENGPTFLATSHWHPNKTLGPLVKDVYNGLAGELDIPMEEFPDVVAVNYTREFLKNREFERPFLAFCSLPGPHSPWLVPKEFGVRYESDEICLWNNLKDNLQGKSLYQKKLRFMGMANGMEMNDDNKLKELLAYCFSYLELIDSQIGELISTLKQLNLYDNTTIIFTADHGDMAGSHGFLSKGGYMYDEIYRIPLVIRYPGCAVGHIKAPVHLMDVTATILHLMSGEQKLVMGNNKIHGKSLIPLMTNECNSIRNVHYAEFHGDWYGHYTSRMVTDGQWKVVWNLGDLCEMYDLENDPGELKNLFYYKQYKDIRNYYLNEMIKQAEELEDYHAYKLKQISPETEDELYSVHKRELCE